MAATPQRSSLDELRYRTKLVHDVERALDRAIAKGETEKAENCRRQLPALQRKATAAAQASARVLAASATTTPKRSRQRTKRRAKALRQGNDAFTAAHFSADPDQASHTVWVFRTGASFHRRDCHIVEARAGAVPIPVAEARARRLERCMHCVPTVR